LKYASGGRCRWLGRAARARCRCRTPAHAGAAPPPWAGLSRALGPLPLLPPLPRPRALSPVPAKVARASALLGLRRVRAAALGRARLLGCVGPCGPRVRFRFLISSEFATAYSIQFQAKLR